MGARRARAHAFVLRVGGRKAGGVERQDDGGQGHPRRPQDQTRAAAPLVVRLRDYTGSHLGPMLHRERLLSITKPSGERTSENAVKRKFNFAEFPFHALGCIKATYVGSGSPGSPGSGMTPSCCIMPRSSRTPQCS